MVDTPLNLHSTDGSAVPRSAVKWIEWAFSVIAALTGAAFGFGFGLQVGGPLIATVAALCAGAMAAILVDAVVDFFSRWLLKR